MNTIATQPWVIGLGLTVIGFFLVRLVNKVDKLSDKINDKMPEMRAEWNVLKRELVKVIDTHEKINSLETRFVLLDNMAKAYFKQLDEVKRSINEI